jgi:4-hydroxybenzoate polyprenyltransferase
LKTVSIENTQSIPRFKLFLALSRTHHGLLDLATPGIGALLWLGAFPSLEVIVLGLITAFAGYTAVYAINDIVDYRSDQEKIRKSGTLATNRDLDEVYIRHPLAQGLLKFNEGLLWAGAWGLLALAGAYLLHPICALIFILGCLLEITYCLLLRVSHLRTLVSGIVKTSGGIAAVFAVDQNPSPLFLIVLFLWIFLWEIGGQNVPNDWTDLEEDRGLQAKTIPLQLGIQWSSIIVFFSLIASVLLSIVLLFYTPTRLDPLYFVATLVIGLYILVIPGYRLYKTKASREAARLFSRASYYPFVMLVMVIVSVLL